MVPSNDAEQLIDLIEDSEGWRDLSVAPGVGKHARQAFAAYANERQREARRLVRIYEPEATVANGVIKIPFPVGSPDRVAEWSPRDFAKTYIDEHQKDV